jgi:type I restriction enzyme, S subunit
MLSGKMYRFRFDDEIVDPRYVEAYLLSETAMRAIDGMKTGISDSGLNLTHGRFRKLQFPLAPRAEQERILTAIEQQLARLDAAETSLVSAQRRLTALRDDALETAFAWDGSWTTLGEIAEIVGGVTKDAKRQHDPAFIDIPYLRVANVQRGYLDLTEIATIRVSQDKAAALALRPGDVLFNEGGDRDKLGRGWVWSGEIESCIHQNHVFRARLHDGFEPKFVSWHGNTFGRRWFEANGRQTTNLASLNLTTLKSFPVPAPPLDRQRRVVAELEKQLSELDATNAAIDRAHRRSSSLRRSILERAFRGELVDQDPADEPASALLERITAKRTVPKLRRKVPA